MQAKNTLASVDPITNLSEKPKTPVSFACTPLCWFCSTTLSNATDGPSRFQNHPHSLAHFPPTPLVRLVCCF
jgi:hypothetical protein